MTPFQSYVALLVLRTPDKTTLEAFREQIREDDRLTSSSDGFRYTYDANGNRITMTIDGVTATYTYDYENRLVSVWPVSKFSASKQSTTCGSDSCTANTGYANPSDFSPASQSITLKLRAQGGVVAQTRHCVTLSWYYVKNGGSPVLMGSRIYCSDANIDVTITATVTLTQGDTVYGRLTWNYDEYSGLVLDALTLSLTLYYYATVTPINYGYSSDGLRTSVNASPTRYYTYDIVGLRGTPQATGECSAGTMESQTVYDEGTDRPLELITQADAYYFHQDGLGSVTSVTTTDQSLQSSYRYDAFGRPTQAAGPVNSPYRYTAREWEHSAGLSYHRARYYEPATGMFLTRDPEGGTNRYAYAGQNPTSNVDPSGMRYIEIGAGSSGLGVVDASTTTGMTA